MVANATAMDMALETPELLEAILLHLDQRQLLFAQHVSRTWVEVIRASPALQESLYFRPRTPVQKDKSETVSVNCCHAHQSCQSCFCSRHKANGLLAKTFKPWFTPISKGSFGWLSGQVASVLKLSDSLNDTQLAALLRRDASWRRMLVAQSPIIKVGVCSVAFSYQLDGDLATHSMHCHITDFEDGLRMGWLYDRSLQFDESDFAVLWGNPLDSFEAHVNWALRAIATPPDDVKQSKEKVMKMRDEADIWLFQSATEGVPAHITNLMMRERADMTDIDEQLASDPYGRLRMPQEQL